MCHVTGFLPYFYIPAPIGFQRTQLQPLQIALEVLPSKSWVNRSESGESRTTRYSSYRNLYEGEFMGIQRKPENTIPKNHS